MDIIGKIEQKHLKERVGKFKVGDTVEVHTLITEGEKDRIQIFTGTVISRKGAGVRETFKVRRIVAGEGVERTWPIHSPKIKKIRVQKAGKVRRAKLYYLRDRVGKATRVKESIEETVKILREERAEIKLEAEAKKKAAKEAKETAADKKK